MTSTASVSIRITGDDFPPEEVTKLIGVPPTLSYRKGETYRAGRSDKQYVGRTSLWLIEVDKYLSEHPRRSKDLELDPFSDIQEQISFCQVLIQRSLMNFPGMHANGLRQFVRIHSAKLLVSVFYFAPYGDKRAIDTEFLSALTRDAGGKLHLDIDHETVEDMEHNKHLVY